MNIAYVFMNIVIISIITNVIIILTIPCNTFVASDAKLMCAKTIFPLCAKRDASKNLSHLAHRNICLVIKY